MDRHTRRVGGRYAHRVIRFLLRIAIFLGSSAIGLLVAAWLVPGVRVSAVGFIAAVVIFTVAQGILSPFFLKMANRFTATVVVWLVTAVATLLLPLLILKKKTASA